MAFAVILRQLMLVVEMFGLESCAGLEAVQMVSNLRALGVPVHLATVPGTVSAIVGIFLIPALGIFMDKYASSKASKAKILFLTSSFVLLGTGLVLCGNISRLSLDIEEWNNSTNQTHLHGADDDLKTHRDLVETVNHGYLKIPFSFGNHPVVAADVSRDRFGYPDTTTSTTTKDYDDTDGVNERESPEEWRHFKEHLSKLPNKGNEDDLYFTKDIDTENPNNWKASTHEDGLDDQQDLSDGLQREKRGIHRRHKHNHFDHHDDHHHDDHHEDDDFEFYDDEDYPTDVPFFAILAMIGYAFIDCGFDSSNCFLKTFAIACVPADQHAGVIVKCVLMSSLGGSFYCIMGLLGVGSIFEYSEIDPNAANTSVQAGLCFLVTVLCLLVTLITGFCFSSEEDETKDDNDEATDVMFARPHAPAPRRQRSRTMSITRSITSRYVDSSLEQMISGTFGSLRDSRSRSTHDVHGVMIENGLSHGAKMSGAVRNYGTVEVGKGFSFSNNKGSTTDITSSLNDAEMLNNLDTEHLLGNQFEPSNALMDFARRQKKQILINVSQFFLIGGLYSFEIYCTNFVSISIYGGDPDSPVGSPLYNQFLKGVEIGTAGVLVYYVSFTFFTFVVSLVLKRIGCVRLMWVSVIGHVIISLALAMFPRVELYFLASVWMGLFRAVINTVPYILANQMSLEQNGNQSTGAAIAAVSAMLPCAFAICSALMGPLMHATGNAAAPIYYSAVSGFFGLVFFAFFKP